MSYRSIIVTIILFISAVSLAAQTFEFTYQGNLKNGGTPANGNFDFEFALFDSGGSQIGSTLARTNIGVADGVFSVQLNFGNNYAGANRLLEIRVRPAGGGAFTTLSPRQILTASPYSIVSVSAVSALNATNAETATNSIQLNGVAASQYVQTTDPRMTNARAPTAGSSFYIQNSSTASSGNFNITGKGTADIVNATSRYEIAGQTFLRLDTNDSIFLGSPSASGLSTGCCNTFVGNAAGNANLNGSNNAFFGNNAGNNNVTGTFNSFFGRFAGTGNTGGSNNSFFGHSAGGHLNSSGSEISLFGATAEFANGIINATAIGNKSFVGQSNSLVLGSINGVNGATADTNVGVGTTTPARSLHVANGSAGSITPNVNTLVVLERSGNNFLQMFSPDADESGLLFGRPSLNIKAGLIASPTDGLQFRTGGNTTRMTVDAVGNVGIGTATPFDKLDVSGSIRVSVLGIAGSTPLCRNASNQISLCSSSERYKSNIDPFSSGLSLVNRLRPVSFNWREGGMLDLGLVAEDVAKIEPLLTTTNDKGEIEGVKYDRIGVVLVNAVKEQQTQIEAQQKQIEAQQRLIEAQNDTIKRQERLMAEQLIESKRLKAGLDDLKRLVCAANPAADLCRVR